MRHPGRVAGNILSVDTVTSGPVDRQSAGRLILHTNGQGFVDLTAAIDTFVHRSELTTGLATIFCRHTSASLTIQENADATVKDDLLAALDRLAPRGASYSHDLEGLDDMPAHIRTMLTSTSLSIPVLNARLDLGQWQSIYLVEHRGEPKTREVTIQVIGS